MHIPILAPVYGMDRIIFWKVKKNFSPKMFMMHISSPKEHRYASKACVRYTMMACKFPSVLPLGGRRSCLPCSATTKEQDAHIDKLLAVKYPMVPPSAAEYCCVISWANSWFRTQKIPSMDPSTKLPAVVQ
jgi:hypothetical protein